MVFFHLNKTSYQTEIQIKNNEKWFHLELQGQQAVAHWKLSSEESFKELNMCMLDKEVLQDLKNDRSLKDRLAYVRISG